MRTLLIAASSICLLASCGNDVAEADRRAQEALGQKREADIAAKQQLLAEERANAATRKAELDAARSRQAAMGQAFAVGPITRGEARETGAIVARALESMGGKARVAAIRTLSGKAELTGAVNQAYDFAIEYPGKMVVDFRDGGGRTTRALLVDGEKAYNITRGRVTEFLDPTLADTLLSIRGDPLCLMITLAAGGEGHQLTHLGQAKVAGKPAEAIRVQPPRSKEILAFFDAQTGRLVATRYEMSQGLVTVIDEQFETTGGVAIGVVSKQIVGAMVSTVRVSDLAINPELPPDRFDAMRHPLIR